MSRKSAFVLRVQIAHGPDSGVGYVGRHDMLREDRFYSYAGGCLRDVPSSTRRRLRKGPREVRVRRVPSIGEVVWWSLSPV